MPTYLTAEDTKDLAKNHKRRPSNREVNPIFDIVSLAEEHLKYTEKRSRNGRLSATSGAGFCELMSFRKANEEVEEEINACNVFWFTYGQKSEDIYIDAMIQSGNYVADQIRLTEHTDCTSDLQLGGFLDILVKDDNNKLRIVEAKTCGATIPSSPKSMHKTQLGIYMAWYGLNGTIFYQSRMVGNIYGELKARQFDIDFDYEEAHRIMTNVFTSRLSIDRNVKPYSPAKLGFKISECQSAYCPFINDCWHSEIEEEITDEYLQILDDAKELATNFLLEENRKKRLEDLFNKVGKCRTSMNKTIDERNKDGRMKLRRLGKITKMKMREMV